MKKLTHLLWIILLPTLVFGQIEFVPNQGQWADDFNYKVRLKYGALFFEEDGLRMHLLNASEMNGHFGEHAHNHNRATKQDIHRHAIKQVWLNAQKPRIAGAAKKEHFVNYFLGKNPEHWQGNIPVYSQLNYNQIYNGISMVYKEVDARLKYNWIVEPNADPSQIAWKYDGADSVWIQENQVYIQTSVGYFFEQLPEVYTLNGSSKTMVDAQFVLRNNTLTFQLSNYQKKDTLIIDPVIVFGSFSGSLADNWGYTATYDEQGNLYGGGIAMDVGYPVTTGALQPVHGNPTAQPIGSPLGVDCAISKFNAQGNALLYSTYLGGSDQDQPQSLFVDSLGFLYVFGVTSSLDFPTSATAFQDTFGGGINHSANSIHFNNGTDIFIAKINPAGTNLAAATYVGGTHNDGLNIKNALNYADEARGEIVIGPDNNVYVSASTLSLDFPLQNASQNSNAGIQDAVIFSMNSSLSTMHWSTYYGGTADDAAFGIKVGGNGGVYICGGTKSNDLAGTSGKLNPAYMGGSHDGFIAEFNQSNGALLGATYLGTSTYDQAFLLDLDKFNNVYVFGQTLGSYPVVGNVYFNQSAKQFVHKLNGSLTQTIFSTTIGKGNSTIDIVPTALNVDDCLNILLSGWGGQTNGGGLGGNVKNMPITPDAFQATTDGNDFYFMVLAANANQLKFATFFGGGTSSEHVDGGTSRFDKNGNIYQAVCAGCGSNSDFPTTVGAVSNTNNSGNCNLGVVKINFETNIKAGIVLDTNIAMDTSCNSLTVALLNTSSNANKFTWIFGNGQTSTKINPTVTYDTLGQYTIILIAEDTICDISDTAEMIINHNLGLKPFADFSTQFTACDASRTLTVTNRSKRANKYIWDFGDGNMKTGVSPSHSYNNTGVYSVQLFAIDTTCNAVDTAILEVDFTSNIPAPTVYILPDECFYGGIIPVYENDSNWYEYEWNFGGEIDYNKYPEYHYRRGGSQSFTLTIRDTICNVEYVFNLTEDIQYIEDRVYIPNAFTPNRDNINEEFIVSGNECLTNTSFQIFDSYGNIIFSTLDPFHKFWNGYINGKPTQEDVYVYVFKCDDFERRGLITVFY